MEISKISLLNFYGTKTQVIKAGTNKAKDVKVDFNQYAYGVPSDVVPHADLAKVTKYPYRPIGEPIKVYSKQAEKQPKVASEIDYVSESSII